MTVLVLTTVLPGGRRSGGEIVSQGIVDALQKAGVDVRVLGYRRPGDVRADDVSETAAGTRPIETGEAGPRAGAWMAGALARRIPYSVAKYRSRAYVRAAANALRAAPSAVLADHAQIHFALPVPTGAPIVYVAHNAESRVYAELATSSKRGGARWVYRRESRLLRNVERDLLRRATQVWALTGEDRDELRSLDRGADLRVLDVPSAVEPPGRASGRASAGVQRYDVALIGNWTWRPNERGLRWFVAEVVPRMPRSASIAIAGAGADWVRGHERTVEILGPVPDANGFLAAAGAVAVPAVGGGGVQVKTLDAIASGAPVVATSAAVRGLGHTPSSVEVADDPEAFAARLARAHDGAAREAARTEAIEWTRVRRSRFESAVSEQIREVIEGGPRHSVPIAREPTKTR